MCVIFPGAPSPDLLEHSSALQSLRKLLLLLLLLPTYLPPYLPTYYHLREAVVVPTSLPTYQLLLLPPTPPQLLKCPGKLLERAPERWWNPPREPTKASEVPGASKLQPDC